MGLKASCTNRHRSKLTEPPLLSQTEPRGLQARPKGGKCPAASDPRAPGDWSTRAEHRAGPPGRSLRKGRCQLLPGGNTGKGHCQYGSDSSPLRSAHSASGAPLLWHTHTRLLDPLFSPGSRGKVKPEAFLPPLTEKIKRLPMSPGTQFPRLGSTEGGKTKAAVV